MTDTKPVDKKDGQKTVETKEKSKVTPVAAKTSSKEKDIKKKSTKDKKEEIKKKSAKDKNDVKT